jgi:hypothetical protein
MTRSLNTSVIKPKGFGMALRSGQRVSAEYSGQRRLGVLPAIFDTGPKENMEAQVISVLKSLMSGARRLQNQ